MFSLTYYHQAASAVKWELCLVFCHIFRLKGSASNSKKVDQLEIYLLENIDISL